MTGVTYFIARRCLIEGVNALLAPGPNGRTTVLAVGRSWASAAEVGDLFESARAGDDAAWAELVERMMPAIWAAARSYGLDRAEAEDVSQTVWLRLFDKRDDLREPERVAGWVAVTARREALAVRRRSNRAEPVEEFELEPDDGPGPEDVIEVASESRLLIDGLRELGSTCQRLLRMLAAKVSYKEIAADMGHEVHWVGPTRQRCLARLRATDQVKQVMAARA